jgi:molybdenum cofactor biosynthesis enzyme MoaA
MNDKTAKGFCVIPWVHMASKPIGTARVCCLMANSPNAQKGTIRDENNEPYNFGRDDFDLIKNGTKARDIRLSMLAGKRPRDCVSCWTKEDAGGVSRRITTNQIYKDEFTYSDAVACTDELGNTTWEPSYWDLRFGNLCNLKCVMCHPASSSQWYDDYVLLTGSSTYKDSRVPVELSLENGRYKEQTGLYSWWNNDLFWQRLEAKIPYLKQLYMIGGEPMLIEPHYTFLQKIIDMKRADSVTLEYDTNLTAIHDRALTLWPNFKQVLLRVSVDDFGEQFNYVRYPAKWDIISRNIEQLTKISANFKLEFTVTWQVLTAFTTVNLLEYLKQFNNLEINIRILIMPEYFDVKILPKKAKLELIKQYRTFAKQNSTQQVDHLIKYLETNLEGDENKVKQCIDTLDKLDSIRNTNWIETFPQLRKYIQ